MHERTHAETSVAARPDQVLAVVSDLKAYPEWADGVKRASVEERDDAGRPLVASLVFGSGPLRDTVRLRYTWEVGADGTGAVRWALVDATTVTGLDGEYRLASSGAGTLVVYSLELGLAVPLLPALRRKVERQVCDVALQGLKRRVEESPA